MDSAPAVAPGKRSWYANLRANPQLTLHVKSGAEGDPEMTAPPITDTGERREMLSRTVPIDCAGVQTCSRTLNVNSWDGNGGRRRGCGVLQETGAGRQQIEQQPSQSQ